MWGATTSEDYPATPYLRFQFTHPVWGATIGEGALRIAREVSIHAPRVGCDTVIDEIESLQHKFQFTHPVWGATQGATKGNSPAHKFQFTHPVWGATDLFGKAIAPHLSFNSRTPCGVRQVTRIHFHVSTCFNSRTPCGVRPADCITAPPLAYSFNSRTPCGVRLIVIFQGHTQIRRFNSRTPCGVRLSCFLSIGPGRDVSIHAPRVGCDSTAPAPHG